MSKNYLTVYGDRLPMRMRKRMSTYPLRDTTLIIVTSQCTTSTADCVRCLLYDMWTWPAMDGRWNESVVWVGHWLACFGGYRGNRRQSVAMPVIGFQGHEVTLNASFVAAKRSADNMLNKTITGLSTLHFLLNQNIYFYLYSYLCECSNINIYLITQLSSQ